MVILVAMGGSGRGRAWASLRIRDLYNDVGKFRISIWVSAIVFCINSVQPATGLVLHGVGLLLVVRRTL